MILLRKEEKDELKNRVKGYLVPVHELKKNYRDFFFHFSKTNRIVDKNFELYRALPVFSFYKEMIGNYLTLGHSMGASPSIWARALRTSFSAHFKFWMKFRKKISEIIFQTLIIYLLTYILVLALRILLPEIKIDLTVILIWQSLGFLCLAIACSYGYQKKFRGFKQCLFSLISFTTLAKIGLPQQKIIELSELNQLKKNSSFNDICEWLLQIIGNWSKHGGQIYDELKLLQDEAWWQFQERMEDFTRFLAALRLFILFIFGLPSYFYIIFQFTTKLL